MSIDLKTSKLVGLLFGRHSYLNVLYDFFAGILCRVRSALLDQLYLNTYIVEVSGNLWLNVV